MKSRWVLTVFYVFAYAVAKRNDEPSFQQRNRAEQYDDDSGVLSNVLDKLPLGGSDGGLLGGLKSEEDGVIERIVDGVLHRNDEKEEQPPSPNYNYGNLYPNSPYTGGGYGGTGAQYPPQSYTNTEVDKKTQKEMNKLARQQSVSAKKENRKQTKPIGGLGNKRVLQQTGCEGEDCDNASSPTVSHRVTNDVEVNEMYEVNHFKTHDTVGPIVPELLESPKTSNKRVINPMRGFKKNKRQNLCMDTYEDVFAALIDAYGEDDLVAQFETCILGGNKKKSRNFISEYDFNDFDEDEYTYEYEEDKKTRKKDTGIYTQKEREGRQDRKLQFEVTHHSVGNKDRQDEDIYMDSHEDKGKHFNENREVKNRDRLADRGRSSSGDKNSPTHDDDVYTDFDDYNNNYDFKPAFENSETNESLDRKRKAESGRRQQGSLFSGENKNKNVHTYTDTETDINSDTDMYKKRQRNTKFDYGMHDGKVGDESRVIRKRSQDADTDTHTYTYAEYGQDMYFPQKDLDTERPNMNFRQKHERQLLREDGIFSGRDIRGQKFMLPKKSRRKDITDFEFNERKDINTYKNDMKNPRNVIKNNKNGKKLFNSFPKRTQIRSEKFSHRKEIQESEITDAQSDMHFERMLLDPNSYTKTNANKLQQNAKLLQKKQKNEELFGFADNNKMAFQNKLKQPGRQNRQGFGNTEKVSENRREGSFGIGKKGISNNSDRMRSEDNNKNNNFSKRMQNKTNKKEQEMTIVTEDQWREHFGSFMEDGDTETKPLGRKMLRQQ